MNGLLYKLHKKYNCNIIEAELQISVLENKKHVHEMNLEHKWWGH